MTPEQREELKAAAQKMVDTGNSNESISAKEYTAIIEAFAARATPETVLSLIAQVEALTVPRPEEIPETDYQVIDRSSLQQFIDIYCRGDLRMGSVAESAFYWFTKVADFEYKKRLDGVVREAQANAVLGFAEAMVEVGIADSRIRMTAAGVAARIRIPSTIPAIPGTKEGA